MSIASNQQQPAVDQEQPAANQQQPPARKWSDGAARPGASGPTKARRSMEVGLGLRRGSNAEAQPPLPEQRSNRNSAPSAIVGPPGPWAQPKPPADNPNPANNNADAPPPAAVVPPHVVDPNPNNNAIVPQLAPPTEADLQNLKDKARYESRLTRCQIVHAKLAAIPEAAPENSTLAREMSVAGAHYTAKSYTLALKVLEKLDLAVMEKSVEARRKIVDAGLRKVMPDILARAAELHAKAESEFLFSDAERRRLADQADAVTTLLRRDAVAALALPNGTLNGLRDQKQNHFMGLLQRLNAEIEQRRTLCKQANSSISLEVQFIQRELKDLLAANPAEMRFKEQGLFKAVQSQCAAREFETALNTVREFKREILETLPRINAEREKWEALEPGLNSLILEARSHETTTETDVLRCSEPYAGATAERLRVLNSRWLARDIPYADAVSEFTECRAAVRKNRLRLAQLLTLEGDREQAKLSVSTALAAATGQITRLRGAIVELGGWASTILEPTKSVASFSKQLEDIKAEWERHLNKVVGVAELDAPAFITRIQAVGNAAVAAVADENALLTYLEGVKRAEILAMTKEWEARIDEVAPIDLHVAEVQVSALGDFKDQLGKAENIVAVFELRDRLVRYLETVKDLASANIAAHEGARGELPFKAISDALAALTAEIKKRNADAEYGELRDNCDAELKRLEVEAAILNDDAELAALGQPLNTLKGEIEQIKNALSGKDSNGKAVKSIAIVRNSIVRCQERLKDKTLADYLGMTKAELAATLQKIERRLGHELPQKTANDVSQWIIDFVEARKNAVIAKQKHVEFEVDIEETSKRAAKLTLLPDWTIEIGQKLEAWRTGHRDESKRAGCIEGLNALKAQLAQEEANPGSVAAQQANEAAQPANRKAKLDQAEWESLSTEFESRIKEITTGSAFPRSLKRAVGKASPAATPREDLERLLENARAKFKIDGDLEAAKKRLEAVKKRADFYEKYPDGIQGATRATLPDALAGWKSSLANLTGSMDALVQEVGTLSEADFPADPGKKAVADEIAKLKSLFKATNFDRPVAIMTDVAPNPEIMRAIREDALRGAGTMLAYLRDDPRFRALANNPFVPTLSQTIAAARLSLLRLERTLLNSI